MCFFFLQFFSVFADAGRGGMSTLCPSSIRRSYGQLETGLGSILWGRNISIPSVHGPFIIILDCPPPPHPKKKINKKHEQTYIDAYSNYPGP